MALDQVLINLFPELTEGKKMSQEPYPECEFCPEKCKFRADAANVFQKDPKFLNALLEIIGLGDQEKFIEASVEKAKEYFRNAKPNELIGLSYCLIVSTLQELDLPKDLKQKMARTMRLKLGRKEIEMTKGATGVSVGREIPGIPPPMAPVAEPSPGASTVQGTTAGPTPTQARVAVEVELNQLALLISWIKSDKKFMKEVSEIRPSGMRDFTIIYNPETEGYLRNIVGTVDLIRNPENHCLYIECSAGVDVVYEYNMAIGPGKKGWCATSIPGASDDQHVLEELHRVNPKEQASWDRLMITLNNDKELIKAVSNLVMHCPITGAAESVKVPVWLMRQKNLTVIRVKTFISKKISPSDVFTRVMETIGEDIDYLREYTAGDRARNVTADDSFYQVRGPAVPTSFDFKFLPKDQQVSLRVCPNCRKPLPDPKAEYRRCPHCLFKLM